MHFAVYAQSQPQSAGCVGGATRVDGRDAQLQVVVVGLVGHGDFQRAFLSAESFGVGFQGDAFERRSAHVVGAKGDGFCSAGVFHGHGANAAGFGVDVGCPAFSVQVLGCEGQEGDDAKQ